jgi:hypothetical protein
MIFYFQERNDPSEPWHVTGGDPAPLLLPRMKGNILTFELQHHTCHNCAELGPNRKFRVELKEPNEAPPWMWEKQDPPKDPGPGLKLDRRVEPASLQKAAKSPPIIVVGNKMTRCMSEPSEASSPGKRGGFAVT